MADYTTSNCPIIQLDVDSKVRMVNLQFMATMFMEINGYVR